MSNMEPVPAPEDLNEYADSLESSAGHVDDLVGHKVTGQIYAYDQDGHPGADIFQADDGTYVTNNLADLSARPGVPGLVGDTAYVLPDDGSHYVAPVIEADAQESVENAIELKEVEGLSQGRIVLRRFLRHRGAMISAAVLLAIIVLVTTSIGWGPIPGWWQWHFTDMPTIQNPGGRPTMGFMDGGFTIGDHPFGQDNLGRDGFARVMRGTQQSLTVMAVIGLSATVIGVLLGSISGFFRGRVDDVVMRFTDMVITIPVIVIGAILGVLVGGANPWTLAIALSFVTWTSMARLVRGQFFALREQEFVDAARVAGASNTRIMFKHILPNAVGVIIVNATLLMAAAILLETALSFLGFGIRPPEVSLGQIINEYQTAFATRPWLFWWPGFFIVTIALCVNFIGDGLRDAFDPRQRRIPTAKALAKADAKRTAALARAAVSRGGTGPLAVGTGNATPLTMGTQSLPGVRSITD